MLPYCCKYRKREKPRPLSIHKWYQCMMVYVNAVIIVGGRLSPGILINHMTVMGQVLEKLQLKCREVNFKAAFAVRFFYNAAICSI